MVFHIRGISIMNNKKKTAFVKIKILFYLSFTLWLIPIFYFLIRYNYLSQDPYLFMFIIEVLWFFACVSSIIVLALNRKRKLLRLWENILSWFIAIVSLIFTIIYTVPIVFYFYLGFGEHYH